MGKRRAKNRVSGRPQPNEFPSSQSGSVHQPPDPTSRLQIPALIKLSDPSASERQWACHSLLYLMEDRECREKLVRSGAIRKVAPLLMDQNLAVREAAASLLRNLVAMDDPVLSNEVAHLDTIAFLTAMLTDSLSQYQDDSGSAVSNEVLSQQSGNSGATRDVESCSDEREEKREGESVGASETREPDIKKQQLLDILCQGIHLLKVMSEINLAIVHLDNLLLVLKLLGLFHESLEVSVAAAQLLLSVVEDDVARSILSCSEHTALLCGIVSLPTPNVLPGDKGLYWPLKASTAGILCHLLPHIKNDAEYFKLLEVILSCHVIILDAHVNASTPEQLEEALNILKAKQVTMEIITNMTYIEEEKCEGDMGEEGEEDASQDCEGMDVDTSDTELSPILKSIMDASIHEKIWKTLTANDGTSPSNPSRTICSEEKELRQSVDQSIISVKMCSLCAIQNLISVLPVDQWSCAGGNMWSVLFALLEQVPEPEVVSAVLVSILRRTENALCVSVEQVQLSVKYINSSESHLVRRDMVVILCEVAKVQLSTEDSQMLNLIGSILRDCISQDNSLLVVCQALDGVFDIFGDDRCPQHLFMSLSLMPTLEQCRSSFKARFQVERKFLEQYMGLVQVIRTNLPRFIDYMKSKSTQ